MFTANFGEECENLSHVIFYLLTLLVAFVEPLICIFNVFSQISVVLLNPSQDFYTSWIFKHLNFHEIFQQSPLSCEEPYQKFEDTLSQLRILVEEKIKKNADVCILILALKVV